MKKDKNKLLFSPSKVIFESLAGDVVAQSLFCARALFINLIDVCI